MANLVACPTVAWRRFFAGVPLIAIVALLSCGCSSLRLHSETREKQGQAAVKAWSEVDLKGYFQAERNNQAQLLDAEVAGINKVVAVQREAEVRVIAGKPIGKLLDYYDVLLGPIVISDGDLKAARAPIEQALKGARTAIDTERAKAADLERTYSFLRSLDVPAFGCDDLTANGAAVDAWRSSNAELARKAKTRLENAANLCGDIAKAQQDYLDQLGKVRGGSISELTSELTAAKARANTQRKQVEAAKSQYEFALRQYQAEVALMQAGRSTVDKTKDLAERAAEALKFVEGVQSFLSEEFVSEARIKRIDALLSSLKAGTELDSSDASKAEIAASLLPKIADDIRAIGQARKGRAAVPLLIQRDIEQARLNSARIQLAIQRKDLVMRSTELEMTLRQALTLVNARSRIEPLVQATKRPVADPRTRSVKPVVGSTLTVHAAWDKLDADDRMALLESTTLYLDAASRQSAAIDALAAHRLALSKDESIDLAEVNASIWAALISATVTQAAEFSALGIKAEQIERILNLLGIFYIGHGVNK